MSDLLEEVRHAARAIGKLVDPAGEAWPKVAAALAAILDDVEQRLASKDLTVLVLGPQRDARVLVDTAIGEVLLPRDRPSPGTRLVVRHRSVSRYLVRLADGTTLDSATALPDRTPFLDEALAEAERKFADAEAAVAELDAQRASPTAAPTAGTALATADDAIVPEGGASLARSAHRLLAWLVALIHGIARLLRGARARTEPPALASTPHAGDAPDDPREHALAERKAQRDRGRRAVEAARLARAAHVEQRRLAFLDELATLSRFGALDRAAVEIAIDYPCALLPSGLALVLEAAAAAGDDAAAAPVSLRRREKNLGGCIVVAPPLSEAPVVDVDLGAIVPNLVPGLAPDASAAEEQAMAERLRADLPSLFQRIRVESPMVVAALATRDVRDRLQSLTTGSAKAEAASRDRLEELERNRVPDAAAFGQDRMATMGPVIDEAVRRALVRAKELSRTRLGELEAGWTRAIQDCPSRAVMDVTLAEIGAAVPGRLATMLDQLMQEVAAEMNRTSETLQVWILDDLTLKYGTLGSEDDATPLMISELSSQAGPVSGAAPLASTREAFERKRVGIGLGGAAAGAALGTLILPGIGTAVGAFVGVLAGFVEGTDALRRRSIEALHEHLGAVEGELASWIDGARVSLTEDLRAAMQETLDGALLRRAAAIRTLLDEQEKAIARERALFGELARVRAALEAQAAHFATLAETAASGVCDLAASRR